jgi:uncharacterized membrane protein YfcA
MPLLALVIGIQGATPLVAFVSTTIAATIVWSSWRDVDFKAAWRLILSSLVAFLVGPWSASRKVKCISPRYYKNRNFLMKCGLMQLYKLSV